jgi:hypothetical protein
MTDLPLILAALSDAHVAFGRISRLLLAEERITQLDIRHDFRYGIEVSGNFAFAASTPPDQHTLNDPGAEDKKFMIGQCGNKEEKSMLPSSEFVTGDDSPKSDARGRRLSDATFGIKDIELRIPKGALVCVFGRVGSGKSALLQGLLGEMRQTHGHTRFGGTVSFVPQTPWIQSASLRDNILFGKGLDVERLHTVVNACALTHDLLQLPDGISTEIGGE